MTKINEQFIKKTVATPLSPVFITGLRLLKVKDGSYAVQLELRQNFIREITSAQGLIGITMKGNSFFNSNTSNQRVVWTQFSPEQYATLGLPFSIEQLENAEDNKITIAKEDYGRYPLTMTLHNAPMEFRIVIKDSLTPRTWVDKNSGQTVSQQPKRAGQNGQFLLHDNQLIYANTELVAKGVGVEMPMEDYVILHNNIVTGSNATADTAAQQANIQIGAPILEKE